MGSHFAGSDSTAASAFATRRRTSSVVLSSPLAYFSSSTSRPTCCGGRERRVSLSFIETAAATEALRRTVMILLIAYGRLGFQLRNPAGSAILPAFAQLRLLEQAP